MKVLVDLQGDRTVRIRLPALLLEGFLVAGDLLDLPRRRAPGRDLRGEALNLNADGAQLHEALAGHDRDADRAVRQHLERAVRRQPADGLADRSEEHTSELQSLMR